MNMQTTIVDGQIVSRCSVGMYCECPDCLGDGEHPVDGVNVYHVQVICGGQWTTHKTFQTFAPAHERYELVCEKIGAERTRLTYLGRPAACTVCDAPNTPPVCDACLEVEARSRANVDFSDIPFAHITTCARCGCLVVDPVDGRCLACWEDLYRISREMRFL